MSKLVVRNLSISALLTAGLLVFAGTARSFDWMPAALPAIPSDAMRVHPVYVRTYAPPARKSVIVDSSGLAHRTADGTFLVRRDRSREILNVIVYERRDARLEIETQRVETPAIEAPVERTERAVAVRPALPPPPAGIVPAASSPMSASPRISAPIPAAPVAFVDQYLTASDRVLAERVRAAILDEDSLFLTAMNIRVAAVDGRIRLDGAVNSEKEKADLGRIAARFAGDENVDNRLMAVVS